MSQAQARAVPQTAGKWQSEIIVFCCNFCAYAAADLAGARRMHVRRPRSDRAASSADVTNYSTRPRRRRSRSRCSDDPCQPYRSPMRKGPRLR